MAREWYLANATIDGVEVLIIEREETARLDKQTPRNFEGDVYTKRDFERGVPSRFYVRHFAGADTAHALGWVVRWSNPGDGRRLDTNDLVRRVRQNPSVQAADANVHDQSQGRRRGRGR